MEITLQELATALVGIGLVIKGVLDKMAHEKKPLVHSDIIDRLITVEESLKDCALTKEEKEQLHDLWKVHCDTASIDPLDGLPRWFCRDLARLILKSINELDVKNDKDHEEIIKRIKNNK